MDLRGLQESFLRYLFEEDSQRDPASEYHHLTFLKDEHTSSVATKLLQVYTVLFETVGLEDFTRLVAAFVRQYRPTSSDPADSSIQFYDFLCLHEIVQMTPMLADLARLELRRFQSSQAPRLPALNAETLARDGRSIEELTLSLQPHVFVSMFQYPVFTVWQWSKNAAQQEPSDDARLPIEEYGESVLTFRSPEGVITRKIDRDDARFLKEFKAGKSLARIEAEIGQRRGDALLEFAIEAGLLVADF